jgi:hypothetical protein
VVDQRVERLVGLLVVSGVQDTTGRVGGRVATGAVLVDRDLRLSADHRCLDAPDLVEDRVLVVELLGDAIARPGVLEDAGEVRNGLCHPCDLTATTAAEQLSELLSHRFLTLAAVVDLIESLAALAANGGDVMGALGLSPALHQAVLQLLEVVVGRLDVRQSFRGSGLREGASRDPVPCFSGQTFDCVQGRIDELLDVSDLLRLELLLLSLSQLPFEGGDLL